jgi:hypothetical protein
MLAILHLVGTFVADLFKSRRRLEAENLFLRHQLTIALRRAVACSFRKFDPAWIRVVRQNHRIIRADACNPALARNVRRRLVQAAMSA